ncbi:conserved hypothetical protein [Histoplasma capsulatum G186AR]|uniref:CENP-V/GFA domain-containing protein n=2 Tax=Ajellomyces capsulatus TaxID=5037 RepID=C0NE06_AJECG|nr:uncharacterized protein HCBG_02099 [Histoplasma capsulatum G186AR]EEH10454.1 conserved hypothetical protein [Histoplasma capsulatum G186AR]KAG5290566.1 hypothetical protein I7I52_07624 [Histoplasma capsulatum]QSS72494.1 hypothetical protein I7I50_00356 [Histoplasma capsulatum G186AR]
MEGRCQCGLIRFTTPLARPLKIYICHCTECRHQSASAYGVTAIFPSFEIPDPEPTASHAPATNYDPATSPAIGTHTRQTLSDKTLECLFCKQCGVRLVHRVRGADYLSVKAGCLEGLDKEMMVGAIHIWCKEAVVEIPEGVERWEEEPDRESLD